MKLLIGGSPCTHWSIAQTKNRETKPEGLGWELFKNYLIARDKFKPDYFLYENNKSMSAAIREQITKELGVEPVLINSALVSAQSRQRLYWVGKRNPDGSYSTLPVEQPTDRGVLLMTSWRAGLLGAKKGYTLKANYSRSSAVNAMDGHFPAPMAAEPVRIGTVESGTLDKPIYEVKDGHITIQGKQYPIKLVDGHYIIRKLTVRECMRLQTVPEDYIFPVSDTQAYKMLGNGWTVDVIAHLLSHIPGICSESLTVLSMYDGMSCGHIALDKLGAKVERYYATEIDKWAIKTTQANYPDTVQLGDAFAVREDGWRL